MSSSLETSKLSHTVHFSSVHLCGQYVTNSYIAKKIKLAKVWNILRIWIDSGEIDYATVECLWTVCYFALIIKWPSCLGF